MNDIYYTGVIIVAFAIGSAIGAAAGWFFFGGGLIVAGAVKALDE